MIPGEWRQGSNTTGAGCDVKSGWWVCEGALVCVFCIYLRQVFLGFFFQDLKKKCSIKKYGCHFNIENKLRFFCVHQN